MFQNFEANQPTDKESDNEFFNWQAISGND